MKPVIHIPVLKNTLNLHSYEDPFIAKLLAVNISNTNTFKTVSTV